MSAEDPDDLLHAALVAFPQLLGECPREKVIGQVQVVGSVMILT